MGIKSHRVVSHGTSSRGGGSEKKITNRPRVYKR